MSKEKVVSRKDLFDSEPEASVSDEDANYGGFSDFDIDIDDDQLEIAEVEAPETKTSDSEAENKKNEQEEKEREQDSAQKDTNDEGNKTTTTFRLFSTSSAVLVNLDDGEEEEDYVKQERPESYYFAKYSDEEKNNFLAAAVTGLEIVNQSTEPQRVFGIPRGKVVNLKEYNDRIMKEFHLRETTVKKTGETNAEADKSQVTVSKLKKRRPGKKTRLARIEMKQRKIELAKEAEKIKLRVAQREKQKKKFKGIVTATGEIIKKKVTRRGGKKNNKKPAGAVTSTSPIFRTE